MQILNVNSASSMIAAGAYLTDADWHDLYDRTRIIGRSEPIELLENAWVGDGATICKGVTIGCNAIVAAGAVAEQVDAFLAEFADPMLERFSTHAGKFAPRVRV